MHHRWIIGSLLIMMSGCVTYLEPISLSGYPTLRLPFGGEFRASRYIACGGYESVKDELVTRSAAKSYARKQLTGMSFESGFSIDSDFKRGFINAYEDLAAGSDGTIPAVPPKRYWSVHYRNAEGCTKAESWFAGYEEGIQTAQASGLFQYNTVPTAAGCGSNCATECESGCQPNYGTPFASDFTIGAVSQSNPMLASHSSSRYQTPGPTNPAFASSPQNHTPGNNIRKTNDKSTSSASLVSFQKNVTNSDQHSRYGTSPSSLAMNQSTQQSLQNSPQLQAYSSPYQSPNSSLTAKSHSGPVQNSIPNQSMRDPYSSYATSTPQLQQNAMSRNPYSSYATSTPQLQQNAMSSGMNMSGSRSTRYGDPMANPYAAPPLHNQPLPLKTFDPMVAPY